MRNLHPDLYSDSDTLASIDLRRAYSSITWRRYRLTGFEAPRLGHLLPLLADTRRRTAPQNTGFFQGHQLCNQGRLGSSNSLIHARYSSGICGRESCAPIGSWSIWTIAKLGKAAVVRAPRTVTERAAVRS
jgi:hypothetical protein